MQPFVCITCGAQRLYDTTLRQAEHRAKLAEAKAEEQYDIISRFAIGCDEDQRKIAELRAQLDDALRALLKIRMALGLGIHSEDNLVEVIQRRLKQ